jgi:DNA-binding transcriptional regulator YiaG
VLQIISFHSFRFYLKHKDSEMASQNPLEVWREAQTLSKEAAAARLGVSLGHYYEWAAGRYLPNATSAAKIKAVTGISRAQLLAWAEEQGAPACQ